MEESTFCSGAWIRTKIHSSRGYLPTISRPRIDLNFQILPDGDGAGNYGQ